MQKSNIERLRLLLRGCWSHACHHLPPRSDCLLSLLAEAEQRWAAVPGCWLLAIHWPLKLVVPRPEHRVLAAPGASKSVRRNYAPQGVVPKVKPVPPSEVGQLCPVAGRPASSRSPQRQQVLRVSNRAGGQVQGLSYTSSAADGDRRGRPLRRRSTRLTGETAGLYNCRRGSHSPLSSLRFFTGLPSAGSCHLPPATPATLVQPCPASPSPSCWASPSPPPPPTRGERRDLKAAAGLPQLAMHPCRRRRRCCHACRDQTPPDPFTPCHPFPLQRWHRLQRRL